MARSTLFTLAAMARSSKRSESSPSSAGLFLLAGVLCNAALLLREQGRFAESLATFDRALKIRPHDPVALNNRGATLNALGRHAKALASYDRALSLDPSYVVALYNRGRALDELNRGA